MLAGGGVQGLLRLEWEKGWHPEIEEPEVAFPHFAKVMRDYCRAHDERYLWPPSASDLSMSIGSRVPARAFAARTRSGVTP